MCKICVKMFTVHASWLFELGQRFLASSVASRSDTLNLGHSWNNYINTKNRSYLIYFKMKFCNKQYVSKSEYSFLSIHLFLRYVEVINQLILKEKLWCMKLLKSCEQPACSTPGLDISAILYTPTIHQAITIIHIWFHSAVML